MDVAKVSAPVFFVCVGECGGADQVPEGSAMPLSSLS